ncbi:hypothetical protein CHGG_09883 [Chaetomium globosum CBS 148.51]|uniref:Beta-lactamase-related domain-containing protein n=1 Tax=Chaetomium globosum (strain ATCC 6205 / CBS 148.51 / DSM 1962 / NBRC 6347 / NRRL 1970) TaxID=306901 RepID=Q2GQ71_CHAGB|nr:uncharacterized protein CHGG_09883 [Chaetomium globosum CBS 148.51]EAQ83479.1 hypothetical protein CHGG_09883 [Chaetomium globosum CBS 148.51]
MKQYRWPWPPSRISLNQMTSTYNTTAVAIGVKSIHEPDLLFEYTYTPPNKDKKGVQKVDLDTIFRLGSLTKVFPVLALLKLKDQGVSLDDPITNSNFLGCSGFFGMPGCNKTVFFEHFGQRPPAQVPFSPQTVYSNIAFPILSFAVEAITNQSFTEYVTNEIWKPTNIPLLPAIEAAGKSETAAAYAGTYTDKRTNSTLTLSLTAAADDDDDDGPGIAITRYIMRGVDVPRTDPGSTLPPATAPVLDPPMRYRLYPASTGAEGETSWRAVGTRATAEQVREQDGLFAWGMNSPLSAAKPVKVLGSDILQGCAPVCLANDDSDQLGVRDDAEPHGVIHEIEQVMLADAALGPFYNAQLVLDPFDAMTIKLVAASLMFPFSPVKNQERTRAAFSLNLALVHHVQFDLCSVHPGPLQANEEEGVHKSHKSNLASPSLAIDQDIPWVDVTASVRHTPVTSFGIARCSLITLDALLIDRSTVYAEHSMV